MFFGSVYRNLFLRQLIDTDDNELTVFITRTKKVEPSSDSLEDEKNEKIRELLSATMQLVSDDSQIYKIHFEMYLMYQCRNESYAYNNDEHISVGQGLLLFEKSKLLDYVNDVMDVPLARHMQHGSKLQHYGIYTLNNTIDVVTFHEPVIEKINLSK
jgi:hypothetical protein